MPLVEERETTRVLPPRPAPLEEPTAPPKVPRMEPRAPQPRPFRWLPWMAGLILVIGLGTVLAVFLTADDKATQGPALADIDPYLNPEVFGVTQTAAPILVAPALADIDPYLNPEVF